jgi:hypothetical protein
MIKKIKGISPIISVVLLVLVAAIFVAGFMSWAKTSTRDKLDVAGDQLKVASDFECMKYSFYVSSCEYDSEQGTISLLVENPTPIDFYGLTLTLEGESSLSSDILKLHGKFTTPIRSGEIKNYNTNSGFTEIVNDINVSEGKLIDPDNILSFTLTSPTCPQKTVNLKSCSVKGLSYALSVSKTGTGSGTVTSSPSGIDCGATCSARYDPETEVTLSASASAGSTFTGWSGEGCSGTGTCVVSMTQARNVTANFDIDTYTLTYTAGSNGSITGTLSQTVNHGEDGTEVTAVADSGYVFSSWSDGVLTESRNETNVTENISVTANFDLDIFSLSCPTGYVAVEGNALYNTDYTDGGFCVMKYEAKLLSGTGHANTSPTCSTGTEDYTAVTTEVTSISAGTPLVSINMCAAKQACVNSGGHLITNDEWMTIARNIEQVPENWSGGSVGSGYLPRGNSDGSAALDGTDPLTGVNKRTLILTNGEIIWDLAGNVLQWTDNVIDYSAPPRYLDNGTPTTGVRWYDYSPNGGTGYYIDPNNLGSFPLEKKNLYLLDESYNANNGVGRIYLLDSSTNRGFLRGGAWVNGANAGVLALHLINVPSSRSIYIGFRCVVVP